jgi:hypothetical protein
MQLVRAVLGTMCDPEDGRFYNGGRLSEPCPAMALDLLPLLGHMARTGEAPSPICAILNVGPIKP